jgi:DNA-binding response OmpR family regulator
MSCDVVIAQSLVSRLHARIERSGARLLLHDLQSANGTFVNGRRLYEPHALANYDLIGLGSLSAQLTFMDEDATDLAASSLRFDEQVMRFYLGTRGVELTPNQFRLLLHLHRRRGMISTREQCAEAVWGVDYAPGMEATTLDRLVSTLRSALRRVDAEANLIQTRPGLGFQLVEQL